MNPSWEEDERPTDAQEYAMRNAVCDLICEEQAQDLIEYALLCGFLAVACITGILQISGILPFFAAVGAALTNAS